MKRLFMILPALIFTSSIALAALTVEGLQIPDTAEAKTSKETIKLPLLGAGLRVKRFFPFTFRVYVASVFAKKAEDWKDETSPVLLQLQFLRSAPTDKIISTFKEGLQTNDVSVDSPEIKKLFQVIQDNGDIPDGSILKVLGEKGSKDKLHLFLSNGKSTTIEGAHGLVKNFFSIWLGKPADSNMEELKMDILKGPSREGK